MPNKSNLPFSSSHLLPHPPTINRKGISAAPPPPPPSSSTKNLKAETPPPSPKPKHSTSAATPPPSPKSKHSTSAANPPPSPKPQHSTSAAPPPSPKPHRSTAAPPPPSPSRNLRSSGLAYQKLLGDRKQWDRWSFEPTPRKAEIPTDGFSLCHLHNLLSREEPVHNICAQLPTALTLNKRFNTPRGYVFFSKDILGLSSGIENSEAGFWRTHKLKDTKVADESGVVCGIMRDFYLGFSRGRCPKGRLVKHVKGDWNARVFVSSNNEAGGSCVVYLTTKNKEWMDAELVVERAEKNLNTGLQKLVNALSNEEIFVEQEKVRVLDAALSKAVADMETKRRQLTQEEIVLAEPGGAQAQEAPGQPGGAQTQEAPAQPGGAQGVGSVVSFVGSGRQS